MKRLSYILVLAALCLSCREKADIPISVIPMPNEVTLYKSICGRPGNIKMHKADIGEEDYRIEITRGGVHIYSASQTGNFYALQTLTQLAGPNRILHTGVIKDSPRCPWRGLMLDEARHFSGTERVKMILDEMARLKLNRFHWHLTDAQGWRIEIKALPRLTETGSVGNHSNPDAPAKFYTQEQIREIIEYAAQRGIMVIPEIDMPGHAGAANRSYPEYSGGDYYGFTFNPGKEETYSFLMTILREVAELFPAPYLHIGGDEASYGSSVWPEQPEIAELMSREHLESAKEVEAYFMNRMADSVKVLGKTLVGWDDSMDVGLGGEDQVIMWWRHDRPDKLRKLCEKGIPTVICPRRPLYFDFIQDSTHVAGREWDGFNTLDDVYNFPENRASLWELDTENLPNVMGIQANIWTETMHTPQRVDFMLFPRICALAEAAWTNPGAKDFERFDQALEGEYARYDAAGLWYFDYRDPSHHPEPAGPVVLPQKPLVKN